MRATAGFVVSNVVDVYNGTTGAWSTAQLSVARYLVAAASVGNLALFAGGWIADGDYSAVVDVYNGGTGAWSTAQLSEGREGLAAVSVGNVALFAGGLGEC